MMKFINDYYIISVDNESITDDERKRLKELDIHDDAYEELEKMIERSIDEKLD